MNENAKKRKQPELVRTRLLDAAAKVAIDCGLRSLTLDLVAQRAGVSKGGLIHHFPSREALITAVFNKHLSAFQQSLAEFVARDNEPRGKFTRAFVKATTAQVERSPESSLFGAFALAMGNDPALSRLWYGWLEEELKKYPAEAASLTGRMVRYAADGIWLDVCTNGDVNTAEERQAVVDHLIGLTYTIGGEESGD
jgi:AcrR family transcriptional regulator